jgi:hypothetical protein
MGFPPAKIVGAGCYINSERRRVSVSRRAFQKGISEEFLDLARDDEAKDSLRTTKARWTIFGKRGRAREWNELF